MNLLEEAEEEIDPQGAHLGAYAALTEVHHQEVLNEVHPFPAHAWVRAGPY